MSDATNLHHALRSAILLRDKVLVVGLEDSALVPEERLEKLGTDLALLREAGARPIVVIATTTPSPPSSPSRPSADSVRGAAVRLMRAISRHGQRATLVPATAVLTVHPAVAGSPAPAAALPVAVDPILLSQLGSLGYITLLLLPVLAESGEVLAVATDEVTAAVGLYLDAALLVFVRTEAPSAPRSTRRRPGTSREREQGASAPPLPISATGRRTLVTSTGADATGGLLSAILMADVVSSRREP